MIDFHCHILPGIDDGAATLEESVELAKQAVADGVDVVVATPHGTMTGLEEQIVKRELALAILRRKLTELQISLKILPGLEYLSDGHSVEAAFHHPQCRAGGGNGPLLLEFPMEMDLTAFSGNVLFQANLRHLPLVMAHPERYETFRHSEECLKKWLENGGYLQMNVSFLAPGWRWFDRGLSLAMRLIAHCPERILLGSDAHHPEYRPAGLSVARQRIVGKFGEGIWRLLSYDNAASLLHLS